jgi:hypothetical protein
MKYEISEKIIKATKCEHNYECLDGISIHCTCSLDNHIYGDKVFLQLNGKMKRNCHHIVLVFDSFACTCPVKIEIIKKYKIKGVPFLI